MSGDGAGSLVRMGAKGMCRGRVGRNVNTWLINDWMPNELDTFSELEPLGELLLISEQASKI